jgi:uncharacterized protein DUF4861
MILFHSRRPKPLFGMWLNVYLLICLLIAAQAQRSETLPLTIENPSKVTRTDELITLPVAEIKKIAPGFDAASCIVLDSNDGAASQLPSQIDDLDGDGIVDEVCFVLGLGPSQKRQIKLVYGPGAPARDSFPKRTQAKFAQHYEGLGWESDVIAYRLYFDERNAIDVYGKHDRRLSLGKFAERDYNYHADSEWGRDVMKIGDALGVGSFGLWKDQQLNKFAKVSQRRWRLIVDGPVRSIIALQGEGWQVAGKQFNIETRFTAVAGQRWTKVDVNLEGASDGFQLATGIVKHPQTAVLSDRRAGYLATWGQQVESAPGDLGLAVLLPTSRLAQFTEDNLNHLALLSLKPSQPLTYYLAAAWDKEQEPITSSERWKDYLQQTAERLSNPAVIRWR